jgi:response regulator RpfG family c-di-GMP phosphodiesterase
MSPRPKLLLVDDEEDNLEYLVRVFRSGYETHCARSGREALEALRRDKFDVIITDQLMPGMTGAELLQRSIEYCPDAIRIVVTGYPDIETAIASLNEGRAFRFFTKPLDAASLVDQVKRALGEQELERENRRLIEELKVKNELLKGLLDEKETLIEAKVELRTNQLREELEAVRAQLSADGDSGALTGPAFVARLEEEVARATRHTLPFAVIAVGVVNLSAYEAANGRGRVVEVARMIFELLRLGSRRYDVVGRADVDRFLLLLPMSNAAGAGSRAARLREALAKFPFPGATDVPGFGFRVGTRSFPEDGTDPAALVEAASRDAQAKLP